MHPHDQCEGELARQRAEPRRDRAGNLDRVLHQPLKHRLGARMIPQCGLRRVVEPGGVARQPRFREAQHGHALLCGAPGPIIESFEGGLEVEEGRRGLDRGDSNRTGSTHGSEICGGNRVLASCV